MHYEKEFPLFNNKVNGVTKDFNLNNPDDRKEYFQAKSGDSIKKLREYFDNGNTFIAYLLGKKNSGKGTYTKFMSEIFGKEFIGHVSIGDLVRSVHADMEDEIKKKELIEYLNKHYRGYISIDDAIKAFLGKSQSKLVPTEFILALLKREIDIMGHKTLFIDGFPRNLDQVSYSIYFRDLINHRHDPDVFIGIDIPESVIDARIKSRQICPTCHSPRNLKLFTTKEVGYDKENDEFYLKCDNTECDDTGICMVSKEGDNLGIEAIRDRLELEGSLIEKIMQLHGIPRILLRNAVPLDKVKEYTDHYEITPEYYYEYDESTDSVKTLEKPWIIKDDEGIEVNSLQAAAVIPNLLKQLVIALGIDD